MNRIDQLFQEKKEGILSIYFTRVSQGGRYREVIETLRGTVIS